MEMDSGDSTILEMAVQLAARLPPETIEIVARAVKGSPGAESSFARTRIAQDIANPYYREIAADFVNCWRSSGQHLSSQEVSLCLLTAAHAEAVHRKSQSVELAWTGPEVEGVPLRRTQQAILQVLDSARSRITLVSYAVYRIPHISEALVQAAGRGVQINVIVETPNKLEGQNEYDTIRALGDDVASCAAVYYWPEEKRKQDDDGKHGILHVKCAVADSHRLFLSSANLTQYAFTLNMELGILVKGGPLPGQVEEQFDRLIGTGVLVRV